MRMFSRKKIHQILLQEELNRRFGRKSRKMSGRVKSGFIRKEIPEEGTGCGTCGKPTEG